MVYTCGRSALSLPPLSSIPHLWFIEYAARRGLSTWPQGARWPTEVNNKPKREEEREEENPNRKLAESQEAEVAEQTGRVKESDERVIPEQESHSKTELTSSTRQSLSNSYTPAHLFSGDEGRSLSACSIWIGSSRTDDASRSKSDVDEMTEEELVQRDGIGIVYMPLIPNEEVPDLDPTLISTWRRELDKGETEKLLMIAKVGVNSKNVGWC